MNPNPINPPILSLADRFRLAEEFRSATHAAGKALCQDQVNLDELKRALNQGPDFELLNLFFTQLPTPASNLWDRLIALNDRAVFAAVLDADAQRPKPYGRSPELMNNVCRAGLVDFFEELLQRGASPHEHARFSYGTSNALGCAIIGGHDTLMDRLLALGVDPHQTWEEKVSVIDPQDEEFLAISLLHLAKTPYAVKRLLALGLDPNQPSPINNGTPLQGIIEQLNTYQIQKSEHDRLLAIMTVLLEGGAHTQVMQHYKNGNSGMWYALPMAASSIRVSPETLEVFRAHGETWPDSIAPESPSQTVLLMDSGFDLLWERSNAWARLWLNKGKIRKGPEGDALMRLVNQNRLDLNAISLKSGQPLLIQAYQQANNDAVEFLTEQQVDALSYPVTFYEEETTWGQLRADFAAGKYRQSFDPDDVNDELRNLARSHAVETAGLNRLLTKTLLATDAKLAGPRPRL